MSSFYERITITNSLLLIMVYQKTKSLQIQTLDIYIHN